MGLKESILSIQQISDGSRTKSKLTLNVHISNFLHVLQMPSCYSVSAQMNFSISYRVTVSATAMYPQCPPSQYVQTQDLFSISKGCLMSEKRIYVRQKISQKQNTMYNVKHVMCTQHTVDKLWLPSRSTDQCSLNGNLIHERCHEHVLDRIMCTLLSILLA